MPRLMPQIRRRRAGFTLVELLVTMALLGVIGTIVARMMMDQQRFFQRTNEQMGVRRELRSAMSMLPADLRSISSVGGDIYSFDATSITFRSTTGASILCGKTSATTLDFPPLAAARTTLTTWYTTPEPGDTLFAFRADSMGAGGDSWTAHRITAVSSDPSYCPGSAFTDLVLDAGKRRWRMTVTPGVADSVKIGAAVRFGRTTRYNFVTGPSGKYYLGRSEYAGGAWTTSTPVAGPFTTPNASGTGGIRFVMYDSLGSVVAAGGNAASISRIDLTLRGEGLNSSKAVAGQTAPKDSIAFRIALRNRQ